MDCVVAKLPETILPSSGTRCESLIAFLAIEAISAAAENAIGNYNKSFACLRDSGTNKAEKLLLLVSPFSPSDDEFLVYNLARQSITLLCLYFAGKPHAPGISIVRVIIQITASF